MKATLRSQILWKLPAQGELEPSHDLDCCQKCTEMASSQLLLPFLRSLGLGAGSGPGALPGVQGLGPGAGAGVLLDAVRARSTLSRGAVYFSCIFC